MESQTKVHMLDEIRAKMEDDHTFLFHVGTTLGAIREQYKSQLEMYRQMRDKFNARNRINAPEYRFSCYSVHFIIAMEEIYGKEVAIENHLLALFKVPAYMFEEQGSNSPSGGLDIQTGDGSAIVKPQSLGQPWETERPYQKTPPKSLVDTHDGMYFSAPKTVARSGQKVEGVAKGMSEDELKRNLRAQYYQRHKN